MQEDGVHDTGAEPGDLEPVPELVLLIISAVGGDQLLLALSLMHFKGVVDAAEFTDLAHCIEEMGEAVVPGAELLLQLGNALRRIDGLAELRLQKVT